MQTMPFSEVPVDTIIFEGNLIGRKTETIYEPTTKTHYNFIDNKNGDLYFFEAEEVVSFIETKEPQEDAQV